MLIYISPFLNTGFTSASLRLLGKLFCVIISLFQMSFNAGAQISDIYFKRFIVMLPKIPFFLLFKAAVFLRISLTSVLVLLCLIAWTLWCFPKFLQSLQSFLNFSCHLDNIHLMVLIYYSTFHLFILSNLTTSSRKVLNSSDKSKSKKMRFHQIKKVSSFSKIHYCLKRFSYLRTHNIFFFPFAWLTTKDFMLFV